MSTGKKGSGQTLVEFALMLPLLLFLVMGLFEIGRAIFYYAVLNNAVREGTRVAIVQDDCDLREENDCLTAYLDSNPTTCSATNSTANAKTCAAIDEKLFNLPELSNSEITIYHFDVKRVVNGVKRTEYYVNIDITFDFSPITPGLNLIGNFPIHVESQMLKTPIAKP